MSLTNDIIIQVSDEKDIERNQKKNNEVVLFTQRSNTSDDRETSFHRVGSITRLF